MLSFVKVPHVRASAVVQRQDMPGSSLRLSQPACATSHWSRAAHGVHYIPLLVLTQAYSLLSPSVASVVHATDASDHWHWHFRCESEIMAGSLFQTVVEALTA